MRRALLAATLVLAGCGGGGSAATTATTATHARASRSTPAVVHHGPRRAAVPILMYHLVNTPPPGTAYPELWVPADAFRSQVQALADAGYHLVLGPFGKQLLLCWRHLLHDGLRLGARHRAAGLHILLAGFQRVFCAEEAGSSPACIAELRHLLVEFLIQSRVQLG